MKLYTVMRMNELQLHIATWMNYIHIMLSRRSNTHTRTCTYSNLKKLKHIFREAYIARMIKEMMTTKVRVVIISRGRDRESAAKVCAGGTFRGS